MNTQYIQHPQPQTRIPSSIQDQSPIRNGQALPPPPVPVYTTQEVARQMTALRHTNTRPPEQNPRDPLHFQYNRGAHLGALHIPSSANTLPPIQPSPSSRLQHHPDVPISPNASSPRQPLEPPLPARRQSDPPQHSPIQVERPQTTGNFDPLVLNATDAALGPVRSALDTVWTLALTNTRLALNKMNADFTHIATQERQKNVDLNAKVTSLVRELQVARHEVNVLRKEKQDLQDLVQAYDSKLRAEMEKRAALKAGMTTGEGTTTNGRSGTSGGDGGGGGGGGPGVPHFDMDKVLGVVTEQVSKHMEKKMSAILNEIEEQKTLRVQAERKFETTLNHFNQAHSTPSFQPPPHSSSSSSSSTRVVESPVSSKVISPADGPSSSGADNTRRSAEGDHGHDMDDVTESARLRRSSTPRKILKIGPLVASPTTTEMMVDLSGFPPSSSSASSPLRLRRSLITDDVPVFRRTSPSVSLGGGQPPRKRSRVTYEEEEERDRKDAEIGVLAEEERRLKSRSGSFANEIKSEPRGSVGPPASSSSTTKAMMAMQVDSLKEEEEEEGSSLRRSAPLFRPRGEMTPESFGERDEDMLVEGAEPREVKPPPPPTTSLHHHLRSTPLFPPRGEVGPTATYTAPEPFGEKGPDMLVEGAGPREVKPPPPPPPTTSSSLHHLRPPLFPPRGEVGPTATHTAPEPFGERGPDMLVEGAGPREAKPPPPTTLHLPSFRVRAAAVVEPPCQGTSSDSPLSRPSSTTSSAKNVVAAAGTATAKKPPTTPTTAMPTVQRSTKLGIGHIDLLYRTDNRVMTCRMCLSRSRDCLKANTNNNNTTAGPIPNVMTFKQEKASWDELISHCRNDHPKTCRDLERMGPAQIAEMKQRMMSGERGMSLRT